jgi:hypothetical protein
MTRDDITKMAREAGWTMGPATLNGLERFAALVAAAEREACANVCDRMVMYGPVAEVQQRYNKAYADCRDKIRERGDE